MDTTEKNVKHTEHVPAKALKAAYRKSTATSLKAFARELNNEDSKAWFAGKASAKLPHKSKSAGMVKTPKAPKEKKQK